LKTWRSQAHAAMVLTSASNYNPHP
jgi:hypothetical protein